MKSPNFNLDLYDQQKSEMHFTLQGKIKSSGIFILKEEDIIESIDEIEKFVKFYTKRSITHIEIKNIKNLRKYNCDDKIWDIYRNEHHVVVHFRE